MQVLCAEYTDTFGGEANYSWVHRVTLPAYLSDRQAMRRAKAVMGLTGLRGRTYNSGDVIEFRPYGHNTVLFIYPTEAYDATPVKEATNV